MTLIDELVKLMRTLEEKASGNLLEAESEVGGCPEYCSAHGRYEAYKDASRAIHTLLQSHLFGEDE